MIRATILLAAALSATASAQQICGESLNGDWSQLAADYWLVKEAADREAMKRMYGDGPIFSLTFAGDQFFSTFYTPNNGSTITKSKTFSIHSSDADQCGLTIAFTEIDKYDESHTNLVAAKLQPGKLCLEVPESNLNPTEWTCFVRS